jgi:hypothetical protein
MSGIEQILGRRHVGLASAPLAPAVRPDEVRLFHEAGDPLLAEADPEPAELTFDPRCAIGAAGLLVEWS